MNSRPSDTIVAPITGMGRAAVAIVRVSGPEAWQIARGVFLGLSASPTPRTAIYGEFVHGDDGLCVLFAEGQSYTGEACAEFSIHGSPASVQLLLDMCVHHGCRLAEPGEFTLRAFLGGRLDLAQAEAVRDVVDAQTRRQLLSAHCALRGCSAPALEPIEEQVQRVLAMVEASVDFEEEIGPLDRAMATTILSKTLDSLALVLDRAENGEILRQGLRIALAGRPNVGKSSLLNSLSGSSKAIVTDTPGTTRDVLEVALDISGCPVILFDTAGRRKSEDPIESEGIRRAALAAESAHLVLLIYAASEGWTEEDEALRRELRGPQIELIGNKCDLAPAAIGLGVSALTGEGIDELKRLFVTRFSCEEEGFLPNPRQTGELKHATEQLRQVLNHLRDGLPDDLLSVGLRRTLTHLGRISGKATDADMLERIFSDFCVGK